MKKIRITEIDPKVMTQIGLYDEGATVACARMSVASTAVTWIRHLKLINKHKDLIEPLIHAKVEDCFKTELKEDDDYIGGAYRETAVRKKDKTCAFRLVGKRGCSLFICGRRKGPEEDSAYDMQGLPITWHRGRLFHRHALEKVLQVQGKARKGQNGAIALRDAEEGDTGGLFEIVEKKGRQKIDFTVKR